MRAHQEPPPTHTHSGCSCNDTISSTIKMRQILKPQESVKLSLVTLMSRIISSITIKSWLYINLIIVKYEGEFACHPGLENWWWELCVMYQCLFYTSCDPVTGSLNRLTCLPYDFCLSHSLCLSKLLCKYGSPSRLGLKQEVWILNVGWH